MSKAQFIEVFRASESQVGISAEVQADEFEQRMLTPIGCGFYAAKVRARLENELSDSDWYAFLTQCADLEL